VLAREPREPQVQPAHHRVAQARGGGRGVTGPQILAPASAAYIPPGQVLELERIQSAEELHVAAPLDLLQPLIEQVGGRPHEGERGSPFASTVNSGKCARMKGRKTTRLRK